MVCVRRESELTLWSKHLKIILIISFETFHGRGKHLSWHGSLGQWEICPPKMLLVIAIKIWSKRLKENQLSEDTKFTKTLIMLVFSIVTVN